MTLNPSHAIIRRQTKSPLVFVYADFRQVRATELNITTTLIVSILAGFSLLASAFMVGPGVNPTLESATTTAPKTIKEEVSDYFKDDPIMVKIAWCESRMRQFDSNGEAFRGAVDSDDTGVMQINTFFHQKKAKELNLDLETLEGNLAYAKHLYEKQGTRPWFASRACWQDEVAMK